MTSRWWRLSRSSAAISARQARPKRSCASLGRRLIQIGGPPRSTWAGEQAIGADPGILRVVAHLILGSAQLPSRGHATFGSLHVALRELADDFFLELEPLAAIRLLRHSEASSGPQHRMRMTSTSTAARAY